MHTAKVTFAILLSIFLLGSCLNKKNELSISSKNFEEEIALQQNLQFTFDKDLYPDSLLQRWDSTAYIVFTTKVQGMFKWNSSSELVFSPLAMPEMTSGKCIGTLMINISEAQFREKNYCSHQLTLC